MNGSRKHRLIEIEWPVFGACEPPARASVAEFEARVEAARTGMDRLGLTHLVVYGDREHFANLAWLPTRPCAASFRRNFPTASPAAGSGGTS